MNEDIDRWVLIRLPIEPVFENSEADVASKSVGLLPYPVADTSDEAVSNGFLFPLALAKLEDADKPENVLIMSGLDGPGLD